MNCEEWRIIPSQPQFAASSLGNIKNLITGNILKPRKQYQGKKNGDNEYQTVALMKWKPGIKQNYYIHRLVAEAFISSSPYEQAEINHKNHRKNDNRPENLEWVSRTENLKHAFRKYRGTKSKYQELFEKVREMFVLGLSRKEVIEKLEKSQKWSISQITWQWDKVRLHTITEPGVKRPKSENGRQRKNTSGHSNISYDNTKKRWVFSIRKNHIYTRKEFHCIEDALIFKEKFLSEEASRRLINI